MNKIAPGSVSIPAYLIFSISFLFNFLFDAAAQNPSIKNKTPANQISEERFIHINGMEQWVTIRGDRSKPVVLFLHGGPGSSLSPYTGSIYGKWEKDFTIVQWDQRGTGKTFGKNAPAEPGPDYWKTNPLTVEQMVSDGVALTEYLTKYLGKQKIILFGTSWGSVLGASIALKRPDLFYAYVGHSQVVDASQNLVDAYQKVYKMVEAANDQKSMDILRSIGTPPYDMAKNAGQLFRVIKRYEAKNSIPAPDSLWKMATFYDNAKDEQYRSDGDDYSFINYVGDKKFGISPMMATVHLSKDGLNFKIPVYLIQGETDILTAKEITKKYFDKIRAPKKEYILVPNAAHGFNVSVVEAQYKIMKSLSIGNK